MTVIDGINVAIWNCETCKSNELWLFRGEDGEGYKLVCAGCKEEQRVLLDEMKLPYLWRHKEKLEALKKEERHKWVCFLIAVEQLSKGIERRK